MIDMTSADPLLRVNYTPKKTESLAYSMAPTLAALKKTCDMPLEGGKHFAIPVLLSAGGGLSHDFTTARAASIANSLAAIQFQVVPCDDYQIQRASNKALEAGDSGQALGLLKLIYDAGIRDIGFQQSVELFRDGTGRIGAIALGGISGATITLDSPEDEVIFRENDSYFFAPTPTADARAAGATLKVLSCNGDGTVTFTANVSTVAGVVDNSNTTFGDYIFPAGSRALSGYTTPTCWVGWEAYIGNGSIHNSGTRGAYKYQATLVDRSASGGGNILDGLIALLVKGRSRGANYKRVTLNTARWGDLVSILQSQKQYMSNASKLQSFNGEIGFDVLTVFLPSGPVQIVDDMACPVNRVWAYDPDLVSIPSLGEPIRIFDRSGKLIVVSDADAVEVRTFSYSNVGVSEPFRALGCLKLPKRT